MRHKLLMTMAVLACAAMGCGDDDDGGSSRKPINLESEAPPMSVVKDLKPEDKDAACERFEAFMASQFTEAEQRSVGCTFLGVLFSSGGLSLGGDGSDMQPPKPPTAEEQAMCSQIRQSCLSSPPQDGMGGMMGQDEEDENVCPYKQDCSATVAEIEACLNEYIPMQVAAVKSLSCTTGLAGVARLEQGATEPASCAVVKMKCPNFFEETENPGSL